MKNRIKFAFRKRLPSFAKDYEATRRTFEKLNPKVVFMAFEANALGRGIVMAAKENDVNVVAMQHGMIKENHPAYYHKKKDLKNYPLPDKTAVYGKKDKKILTENSFYPKKKITAVGSPRYDIFSEPDKLFSKKRLYKKLGLDKNKKLVVWATQISWQGITKEKAPKIFKIAKELDFNLVVKLHPRDPLKEFYEKTAEKINPEVKIVRDIELMELLYASNLVLTYWSTVALEAMVLKKPVITMAFSKEIGKNPYAKSGAAIKIKNIKQLRKNIKAILNEYKNLKKIRKDRKRYLEKQLYKIDGNASKRVVKLLKKYT